MRASSAGDTKVGNDGFKALDVCSRPSLDRAKTETSMSKSELRSSVTAVSALKTIPESPPATPSNNSTTVIPGPRNAITCRDDSGIEGYGIKEDGTLANREIYFCGIIDILQYYNARKMGETVIRKAAGDSDPSCVDPEAYGRRFVKFVSMIFAEE